MEKLIRDRIPEICALNRGEILRTRVASEGEMVGLLTKKLFEEAIEFRIAASEWDRKSELADVIDVVFALGKAIGMVPGELRKISEMKLDTHGGFDNRLVLMTDEAESDADGGKRFEPGQTWVTAHYIKADGHTPGMGDEFISAVIQSQKWRDLLLPAGLPNTGIKSFEAGQIWVTAYYIKADGHTPGMGDEFISAVIKIDGPEDKDGVAPATLLAVQGDLRWEGGFCSASTAACHASLLKNV